MKNKKTWSGLKFIAVLWILLLSFANVPGKMEANFMPVIEDLSYSVSESTYEPNASDMYFNFEKLRPECAFKRIDFFLYGEDSEGNYQNVTMRSIYKGSEAVRFKGRHDGVGPWVIMVPPEDLNNLSMSVRHRCHVLFDTITVIRIRNGEVVPTTTSTFTLS